MLVEPRPPNLRLALGLTASAMTAIVRALAFLVLWLAVAGPKPSNLVVGIATALAAAWLSLRLAPPSGGRLNLPAAFAYFGRFLRGSFASGLDVALRALRADPDLRPGLVEAEVRLRPGFARAAFCVIANLLPGTLITGFDSADPQKTFVHGLDTRKPVAADLAAEEASFMRLIGQENFS